MAEFCKKFNDDTAKLTPGMPVPTLLTAYEDRTYSFEMKTPPTMMDKLSSPNLTTLPSHPRIK